MKTLVLAAALLFAIPLASAPRPASTDSAFTSGNELLQWCGETQDGRQANEKLRCIGFIAGTEETLEFWKVMNEDSIPKPLRFCFPDGVTNGQIIKVFVKYLNDHPADLHHSAVTLFMQSQNEAFPCPAK